MSSAAQITFTFSIVSFDFCTLPVAITKVKLKCSVCLPSSFLQVVCSIQMEKQEKFFIFKN